MADHANHTKADAAHVEHAEHADGFYWKVGGVLAAITAIEVAVTFIPGIHGTALLVAILLILSVVKGAAVVMLFMHLRGDARIFQFVFLVPFSFAITMCLMFLTLFGNYVGIAG